MLMRGSYAAGRLRPTSECGLALDIVITVSSVESMDEREASPQGGQPLSAHRIEGDQLVGNRPTGARAGQACGSGPNRQILYIHKLHPGGNRIALDNDVAPRRAVKRIHVVLDEAFDPFTAVCAVAFTDDEFIEANNRILALRDDLGQSGYLSALNSYKKFLSNGFHATDDTTEVSVRFIDEVYKRLPGKAFIYYTDGQRRRDLSAKKTVLLLYACVIQVILLHHKDATEVQLHFETHQQLQRFYPGIADLAARRSRSRAEVGVDICSKGDPPSLALADYILHIFGQSIQFVSYGHEPTEKFQYRNLLAIKNHVSLIYSMEFGRVAGRRSRW